MVDQQSMESIKYVFQGLFVSNNPFYLLLNQCLNWTILNTGSIIRIDKIIDPVFIDLKAGFNYETNRFTD